MFVGLLCVFVVGVRVFVIVVGVYRCCRNVCLSLFAFVDVCVVVCV